MEELFKKAIDALGQKQIEEMIIKKLLTETSNGLDEYLRKNKIRELLTKKITNLTEELLNTPAIKKKINNEVKKQLNDEIGEFVNEVLNNDDKVYDCVFEFISLSIKDLFTTKTKK